MDKKYQIFISSTYKDLIDARKKVSDEILKSYNLPIGMELFSASDKSQWEIITKIIDETDYYVLILGHRYGSLNEDGIGYTEMEYDYAKSLGIPILSFVRKDDVSTKPSERESDPLLLEKLKAFKEKVTADKMCEFWETEDELNSKVMSALYKEFYTSPRIGWVRGDRIKENEALKDKNLKLQEENNKLKLQLEKLKLKESNKRVMKTGYTYEEIKILLENKTIKFNTGEFGLKKARELSLLEALVTFETFFSNGVASSSNGSDQEILFHRIGPHLITMGLAENKNKPKVYYTITSLTEDGRKFLTLYNLETLKENKSSLKGIS